MQCQSINQSIYRPAGDKVRGNALFLILIAVALFAALSYAITQSSRGGGNIDKEQAKLDTAVAQLCTARVDQAVMRLKITGGCTDGQISYEYNGNNVNADAPEDKHCHVFDPAGAGETACGTYLSASNVLISADYVWQNEANISFQNGFASNYGSFQIFNICEFANIDNNGVDHTDDWATVSSGGTYTVVLSGAGLTTLTETNATFQVYSYGQPQMWFNSYTPDDIAQWGNAADGHTVRVIVTPN